MDSRKCDARALPGHQVGYVQEKSLTRINPTLQTMLALVLASSQTSRLASNARASFISPRRSPSYIWLRKFMRSDPAEPATLVRTRCFRSDCADGTAGAPPAVHARTGTRQTVLFPPISRGGPTPGGPTLSGKLRNILLASKCLP